MGTTKVLQHLLEELARENPRRDEVLRDLSQLYTDIANGDELPNVDAANQTYEVR